MVEQQGYTALPVISFWAVGIGDLFAIANRYLTTGRARSNVSVTTNQNETCKLKNEWYQWILPIVRSIVLSCYTSDSVEHDPRDKREPERNSDAD